MNEEFSGIKWRKQSASRRAFLGVSLLGLAGAVAAGGIRWSGQPLTSGDRTAMPKGFLEASRLLTGHPIQPPMAEEAWAALCSREKGFEARFAKLDAALRQGKLTTMAGWQQSPVFADAALKVTALAIVSAWYLGVVGEVMDRSEDGPAFITYEGALMWRPTMDVTVIPTYARGGPGFWKDKPPAS
ncbi:sugar dehydrogenase complex small subunit [Stenotrophomonas rhizophila]|uniref:sugar dehydrogenase complex small subunit n=1 Tax=Stenotrophomonas rhizophila TaxID=216778 RepID=UPI000EAB8B1B|nr:sugar dehydrogenase complex small subunit [Stenotrophomonas rhizophila]